MKLERLGDAALRWDIDEGADRGALLDALRRMKGVVDAVVTERHACVVLAPDAPFDPACLEAIAPLAEETRAVREHVVRVRYDGEDLAELAAKVGISPEEVARRHAAGAYTVSFVGFLPGWAYLRGLDPSISVPRRPIPRTRVPAFAVGIAAGYTGIYPFASPGGWNLVGTAVGFAPFDAERGAAFRAGDRVRFEAAP
jgi:UPF0271 protein